MVKNCKILINIIIGIFLSFLVAWSSSYLFTDSLVTYDDDKILGFNIFTPESTHYHRSEGWGETKIGKHGIIGATGSVEGYTSKIAIWGDSYVEAFQINDIDKMGARLKFYLEQAGINELTPIQIGQSGCSIPDYCYKIPQYEKVIPNIRGHYIVIGNVSDLYSDEGVHCRVTSSQHIYLSQIKSRPKGQKTKKILSKLKLDFIWDILKQDIIGLHLHFTPSFIEAIMHSKNNTLQSNHQTFDADVCYFLIDQLKACTSIPITIIYCPHVPEIKDGVIVFEDRDYKIVEELKRQCERKGIRFINMKSSFCEYYLNNLAFVRGFPNSQPASGHMNESGHNLVAKAIFDSILSNIGTTCFSSK